MKLLSGKEYVVMDLLRGAFGSEMYGLEMIEASEGQLKRGTIYVTLQRMERKGLIDSRAEERAPGEGGLPRRLYRPTGYGARVLQATQAAEAFVAGGEPMWP